MPSRAPGSVTPRTITASSRKSRSGISTFEQRSIPFRMPKMIMPAVMVMKMTSSRAMRPGSVSW